MASRWLDRFGWRALLPAERTALLYFWREVGRRLNIKDLPENSEAFEAFSDAYEQDDRSGTPAPGRET